MTEEDAFIALVEGKNSWAHPKCNRITGVIANKICTLLDIEDVDRPLHSRNSKPSPHIESRSIFSLPSSQAIRLWRHH